MLNDTGNYTVRVDVSNGTHIATSWLEIRGELTGCPISLTQELNLEALGVRLLGDLIAQFSHNHLQMTLGTLAEGCPAFPTEMAHLLPAGLPFHCQCISDLLVVQHNK